jgi:predicted flap endonuclease-1-like 5' DNA nuclease
MGVLVGLVAGLLLGARRPGRAGASRERADILHLRQQLADLGGIAADHDRLLAELDDCRERLVTARTAAVGVVAAHAVAEGDALLEATAERDALVAHVAALEATIGDLRARLWNQDAKVAELQSVVSVRVASTAPPTPDLAAAAALFGEPVRHDDLTVVEGIGPKIADLLQRDGGIRTWWELHLADVATLRALLASAGPRFQVHDPSSWPEQAGLLAHGEWEEFQTFVAGLKGGKLGM